MTFKDQVAIDNAQLFINVEEFGEYREIDGVLLRVMVKGTTAAKSARVTENFALLHGDFMEVYFETSAYLKKKKRVPKYGDYIRVGEKRYSVVNASDEMGITHLRLDAYRQNQLPGDYYGKINI